MEKHIVIKVKNVYGTDKIYPVCDQAMIFASLVGQKTLTLRDINQIIKLGYTIGNQVAPDVEVDFRPKCYNLQ